MAGVYGQPGEAFTLSGRAFERWQREGDRWRRTASLRVEYDARHQRFHFRSADLRRVPTHWITALDRIARKVLPAQS